MGCNTRDLIYIVLSYTVIIIHLICIMGYNNDATGYIRGYMMGYIMGYTVTNDDLRSVRGDRRPRAEPIGDQAAKASHTAAVEKPLPWSL